VFDASAQHLADKDIAIVDANCTDRTKLMEFLTRKETTSATLKLATVEAMAWLSRQTISTVILCDFVTVF